MYEIHLITKEMDRIINKEIVNYIVNDDYIYMKNSKDYIFYFNKDFIREIRLKEVNK